jgi:hypothetical protein
VVSERRKRSSALRLRDSCASAVSMPRDAPSAGDAPLVATHGLTERHRAQRLGEPGLRRSAAATPHLGMARLEGHAMTPAQASQPLARAFCGTFTAGIQERAQRGLAEGASPRPRAVSPMLGKPPGLVLRGKNGAPPASPRGPRAGGVSILESKGGPLGLPRSSSATAYGRAAALAAASRRSVADWGD